MAFKDIQPLAYPDFRVGAFAFQDGGIVLDAADEAVAHIVQAPVSDSIASVRFRVRNHTTGATLEIRLETVVGGEPSGTLLAAGAEGSVTTTGVDDYEATITTPPSLTAGDLYAVVIKQPAIDAGNCAINCLAGNETAYGFPFVLQKLGGGGWVRNGTFSTMSATSIWTTAGIVPGMGEFVFDLDQALTINTGTSPDERGNKFVLDVPVRVSGCVMRAGTATGNLVLTLYDGDDVSLATVTIPSGVVRAANMTTNIFLFPEPVELTAGETYRLTYQSDSASNVVGFQALMTTSGNIDAVVPSGYVVSVWRTDGGAWSESDLGLVYIGLLINGLDDGAGGGGGGGSGSRGRIVGATA